MSQSLKAFNLPWQQHDAYFLALHSLSGAFNPGQLSHLNSLGFSLGQGGAMLAKTPRAWKPLWDQVYRFLQQEKLLDKVKVSLSAGKDYGIADAKSPAEIQHIAESLWLGDALISGRVVCYLQPVMSSRDKIFGYESFARVQAEDGSIIAGDRIVEASKVLGVQNMIDRHLHVQAIKTFVSSDFNGFLFINFFPGFIQRPEVYLEGLTETVKSYGMIAQHVVMDFTRMETPRDVAHIKSVCNYGRSKGYSLAFDDITSAEGARKIIMDIRPDFVKIDTQRLQKLDDSKRRDTIRSIVELVHGSGGTVIAEGVETEESYLALELLGVDLFQGYFFSPPVPVDKALGQKKA